MTIWDYINVAGRLALTVIAVYKLTHFRELMIVWERFGLAMMGGGSFVTIPVIVEKRESPMDGWAVAVLTIGAVVFLAGRTWRDRRHQRNNDMHVRWHEEWKRSRG